MMSAALQFETSPALAKDVLEQLCDLALRPVAAHEEPSDEFVRIVPDLLSVALAGSVTASAGMLSGAIPDASAAIGQARIWGQGRVVAPRDAVLCNAFSAHVLDFDDDETEVAMAHLSVTLVSAALTLCDAISEPINGCRLFAALSAGYDVALALGGLTNPQMYRAGWHATATLGPFAAAATCGRLFDLTAEQMASSLALAASFSGGVRGAFGGDGKPMQVAQAAASGLLAAQLAKAGLTSTAGALVGARGFLGLHNARTKPLPSRSELPPPGFVVKAYPTCTATHAAIAAVLDAVSELPTGAGVDRIQCLVDPFVPSILLDGVPATADAARFNLAYCLARAALDGRLGPDAFQPEALRDARVLAVLEKVEIGVATDLPKGPSGVATGAHVTVFSADGQIIRKSRLAAPGSVTAPLTDAERLAKFTLCLEAFCNPEAAAVHFSRLLDLPRSTDARATLAPLFDLVPLQSFDALEHAQ